MSGPVKDPLRALQGARSRAQGGRLEEQIEASCALLTETGRADISKTPEPMKPVSQPNKSGQFRAVYTKKAEPDFKGVMLGGRAVMFEAKSTGTGRLNKDRVLPEQVKKLDSYTALGAHCFIVATFDGLRVYRIPWTVWRSMKQRYGRNYVTEADIKEYAVRFGPGFTPDLLRGIPTMYDINPLSNVSDVLTAFCGMPYGTQPETEEWRAAVYRFDRFMNWTTPERFVLVDGIRRERQNMENPIFTFMQLWITHNGEREKLRFPVLPTKFDVTHGTKNTSVTISGLGEILVLQDRAAVEVSWDSFFPAAYFPGIQTPFMLSSPDAMIQRLFEWKISAKPVHLILTGTRVNFYAAIQSLQPYRKGGDPGSIYYKIKLKEYREVRIRQVKVSSTGTATVSGGSTRTDNRVQAKTYTVKPGDCLYNISKSTLGDGGRYNEIYSLNKDKLKNPNLIYPGQVLQLP